MLPILPRIDLTKKAGTTPPARPALAPPCACHADRPAPVTPPPAIMALPPPIPRSTTTTLLVIQVAVIGNEFIARYSDGKLAMHFRGKFTGKAKLEMHATGRLSVGVWEMRVISGINALYARLWCEYRLAEIAAQEAKLLQMIDAFERESPDDEL